MKDYYLILNIPPFATTEEIKKAYRLMSQKYHPDKNQSDIYFEERFKDIQEASSILTDVEKRKQYDYSWIEYNKNFKKREKEKKQSLDEREEEIKRKEVDLKYYEENIQNSNKKLRDERNQFQDKNDQELKVINERDLTFRKKQKRSLILLTFCLILFLGSIIFFWYSMYEANNLYYKMHSAKNIKLQKDVNALYNKVKIYSDSIKFLNKQILRINESKTELSSKLTSKINELKNELFKSNQEYQKLQEKANKISLNKTNDVLKYKNNLIVECKYDIQILDVKWSWRGFIGENNKKVYGIESFSVFNGTKSRITILFFDYIVYDKSGRPLDSGNSDIKFYSTLNPSYTKKTSSHIQFGPSKLPEQSLKLIITGYQ